jgi:ketosteroid isomerase-like protein
MTETPAVDPIEAGLRAWTAGDLDALEEVLAPDVSLLAVEPGQWDCVGREQVMALLRRRRAEGPADPVHLRRVDEGTWTVTSDAPIDPDGPERSPHSTRITVAGGRVTEMQQYRADTPTA